eukprot:8477451-Pyramimonas_sp.AAC.1
METLSIYVASGANISTQRRQISTPKNRLKPLPDFMSYCVSDEPLSLSSGAAHCAAPRGRITPTEEPRMRILWASLGKAITVVLVVGEASWLSLL